MIDMLRKSSRKVSSPTVSPATPSKGTTTTTSIGAQFIFTAHKKEMVERADFLFRVKMVNNQSRIHRTDLAEAVTYFAKRRRQPGVEDADSPSSLGSTASSPAATLCSTASSPAAALGGGDACSSAGSTGSRRRRLRDAEEALPEDDDAATPSEDSFAESPS